MKKLMCVFLVFGPVITVLGQQTLTLGHCYTMAEKNHPLLRQRTLVDTQEGYALENISRGSWPQLNLVGQGTYQSEVTQVPLKVPGQDIPLISKDQYRLYAEITQPLYNGGTIRHQGQMEKTKSQVEIQALEVERHKLKERINQLYFALLLTDGQRKQVTLLKKDLELGIRKAKAAVSNGIAPPSTVDMLEAERLKVEQRETELQSMRRGLLDGLGIFLNEDINDSVTLETPPPLTASPDITRPEINYFDFQRKNIEAQKKWIQSKTLPKLHVFFQGGLGRPALNMLNNEFKTYYIGGIRLNWALSNLYTYKNEVNLMGIQQSKLELQQETFLLMTRVNLKQQQAEIDKLSLLLRSDDEIIDLRNRVKNASLAQLENGVISAADYTREANAEDQARQNKNIHAIQWLMAQYQQQLTSGN